jgi:Bacterial Ig-like domain (group 3)/FG-GAP-like repeat/FG-GAP repeat
MTGRSGFTRCTWIILMMASLSGAQTQHHPFTPREFLPARTYATGGNPSSVAIADFDGDGNLDLAVANWPGSSVSILLGNGDGTFQTHVDYATADASTSVAVGDFNGDGKLDLAVTIIYSNTLAVLLGNGDGTFQPQVDYPTGNAPEFVAAGDFNRDGKLDLAVTNNSDATVSILLGNGDGTFQPGVPFATGPAPGSLAVADLNHDGKLDLAVTNYTGNSVSILLGNGDGTFRPQAGYATDFFPTSVTVGDFNGDHKLDLAIANIGSEGTVSVLIGNGNGTFQPQVEYKTGTGFSSIPFSVAAADVNGDGKLDLVAANEGDDTGNACISVLLGNGDGTFGASANYFSGSSPGSLAIADFNHDGAPDLVSGDLLRLSVDVLLNTGGTRPSLTSSINPSRVGQPVTFTSVVKATFNKLGTPTGTLTFKDGTHTLGTVPLVQGKTSLTTSSLSAGSHNIQALYSGDSNFYPNTSPPIIQQVAP